MIRTYQFKLLAEDKHKADLNNLIDIYIKALNWISECAFRDQTFSHFHLQRSYYRDVRCLFNLGANMACSAFVQVAASYKLGIVNQHKFKPHSGIQMGGRTVTISTRTKSASLWTTTGRTHVKLACPDRYWQDLASGKILTTSTLIQRDGNFFLNVRVESCEPPTLDCRDVLGVDLGIAIIAADSDGNKHSGCKLNQIRHRHQALRSKLQRIGTKSAKRLLKKRSRKESRFVRDTNHKISKRIVQLAKRTSRAVAIEDLTGIRSRIKARKSERTTLHGWSFAQLGTFLDYKAKRAGIPLVKVDPAYTSQRCSECGHTEKANRKTRDEFCCVACGHVSHADTNGAKNIRLQGLELLGSGKLVNPNAAAINCGQIHGRTQLQVSNGYKRDVLRNMFDLSIA